MDVNVTHMIPTSTIIVEYSRILQHEMIVDFSLCRVYRRKALFQAKAQKKSQLAFEIERYDAKNSTHCPVN